MFFLIGLIIIIVGVVLSIIITVQIKQKKYLKFVNSNSIALRRLSKINRNYKFYNSKCFDKIHTYDNEIFYESISCEDYLTYQLQFNLKEIQNEIRNMSINKERYNLYSKEIANIQNFGQYAMPYDNLKKEKLISIEKGLFEENKLKPKRNFTIKIILCCSKINGDTYKTKEQTFCEKEILKLIERLNNKNGQFYNDKGIWNSLCRVERGKVSNKMRFSIYKRDGYRCKICGRSEMFDYLEIDHIKPIAKGGKTVYSNLQTLCQRCNREKGDSY